MPYDIRSQYSHFFYLNPLDGEREFVRRSGHFTVSVALCAVNQPVLGAVCVPAGEAPRVYFGGMSSLFRGAFVRYIGVEAAPDIPLAVATFREKDTGLLVIVSKSYQIKSSESSDEVMDDVLSKQLGLVSPALVTCPSTLRLLLLAEGRAHLYPCCSTSSEYHTAASHAVLLGAGGGVYQLGGNEEGAPILYNKPQTLNPSYLGTAACLATEDDSTSTSSVDDLSSESSELDAALEIEAAKPQHPVNKAATLAVYYSLPVIAIALLVFIFAVVVKLHLQQQS